LTRLAGYFNLSVQHFDSFLHTEQAEGFFALVGLEPLAVVFDADPYVTCVVVDEDTHVAGSGMA